MRVGISTATFFLKLLTEDSFSVIQRCNADVCEVFLTTFSEYKPEFIELLNKRRGSVEVYSIHALNTQFEPQLFNGAPRTRADAEKIYRDVLEAGRMLGAKAYTFHGLSRLKKNAWFDPVAVGKRLEELALIAKEYGIKLCLENVHWATFNAPEFFERAKPYCPDLGTVLDIKQARQSGYDWREYIDVMGDTLYNVHLSDVSENGEITMIGKGVFPFGELIDKLRSVGYDGTLMIEQYARNYDSFDEVKASKEYLENILKEHSYESKV